MASTYVDVHVIQTVPPSNLNRDETGSPKSARYGGVRRARVSSQAWKRATRLHFHNHLDPAQLGVRTRRVIELLAHKLSDTGRFAEDKVHELARATLESLGLKTKSAEDDTSQFLLFMGMRNVDAVVSALVDRAEELGAANKTELKKILKDMKLADLLAGKQPIDVALFGRMVADVPAINVDAAAQVSHAISTHPVNIEFDYFTAVDDENPAEDTGAGMIGTVEFNSATLYRYASVSVDLLAENLGEEADAPAAVGLFIDSFIRSMPTGHQTSFAHRTLPEFVQIMVRDDQPVNLVGAFEQPVEARRGSESIAMNSIAAFLDWDAKMREAYGLTPLLTTTSAVQLPEGAEDTVTTVPLAQAIDQVVTAVSGERSDT